METFLESLNRLKDIHEKEVLGLQNKLLELNSERCRDAQRVEELCAKNQQLREQHKALKENVHVLENRLRAGLCDRCIVTQELARKKQQEFEVTLLQHLQHVFILTNKITRLQEENETLKEEVTRLRDPGPKPQCPETTMDCTPPGLLPSPGPQKSVTERPPGGHQEAKDARPEKLGYKTSPVARVSPGANLAEPRAPDVSPQRISNQLHGTIAVVRPGAQACSADRGSANGTPPLLPARDGAPSPPPEHSLPLDSLLRASGPPSRTCPALKRSLQADRLCLLNRQLFLQLRSPHSSPRDPNTALGGPQGRNTREAEAWEDPMGLGDLPDPRLEGALHLLLVQRLQACGARRWGPPWRETLPSPPGGSDSEGPEGKAAGAALPGGPHPRPAGPDKPLDLSERGRGRDTPKPSGRPGSLSPQVAHTPSPEPPPPRGAKPTAPSGPWGRSSGTKGARALEPEPEPPPTPEGPPRPLPGSPPSWASPGGSGDESRERPTLSCHLQRPEVDGHPGLSTPEAQRPGSGAPQELDTSDREVDLSPETEAGVTPSPPGEGPRCLCTKERGPGPQQKRKRDSPSDPWDKASKKPS